MTQENGSSETPALPLDRRQTPALSLSRIAKECAVGQRSAAVEQRWDKGWVAD